MKIFADENIPLMTVHALRNMGYDVIDVHEPAKKGMTDNEIWGTCQREGRLLISTDKGFAQHRDEVHHGMLIVRLRQPSRQAIHERVLQAVAQFGEETWPSMLVVMRDSIQSVWRSGA